MRQVPVLHTYRCSLSAVSKNDIPVLLQILNDGETRRFLPDLCEVFHTADRLITFIGSFDNFLLHDQGILWGIRTQDELIGFIGVMDIPDNPTLFYAVHPDYRRCGYLKETLTEVMRFVRESNLCPTIQTEVFADNIVSQKVLTELDVRFKLRERE